MRGFYSHISLLVVFLLFVVEAIGQGLTFQNPSFEGQSQAHVMPAPWDDCYGTPDTQPGQWGITQPASDGNTYISMLHAGGSPNGYSEGATQQLSSCMQAGVTYNFDFDAAFSSVYNTAEPGDCYGSLRIWGGTNNCGQQELLWESGYINCPTWHTYTTSFTPSGNWCYLTFEPYFITACSGYINCMLDNLQPVSPVGAEMIFTYPQSTTLNQGGPCDTTQVSLNMDSVNCSFTMTGTTNIGPLSLVLTGDFIGSPINATLYPNNDWDAYISYPPNFTGPQTIVATATFPNNEVDVDSVIFNVVSPTADFTYTNVCSGYPVIFTDATISTDSITIWHWDFGDGQTSDQQSPSHSYANVGTYDVTLDVESSGGCLANTTEQVSVFPGPTAAFSATEVCLGVATQFADESVINGSNLVGWTWDFGDGQTSDQQHPNNTYAVEGTYTVTLTVETADGCLNADTQQVIVNPVPVADFTHTDTCLGIANEFFDQSSISSGNILTWTWDFGDGGTSDVASPTHQYAADGQYTAILEVEGVGGCTDTASQQVVVYPAPVVDFDVQPVCLGDSSHFVDLTVMNNGTIASWLWDFGDGNTSDQQNPVHLYQAANTYTVTLTVASNSGCVDEQTLTAIVNIVPEANFSFNNTCADSLVTFTNTSNTNNGVITGYLWEFGDLNNSTSATENTSFVYTAANTYNVTFTVTAAGNCVDDTTQQVSVYANPDADFDYTKACFGEATDFTDQTTITGGVLSSWQWDFGDGSTSNQQNPSHPYGSHGVYNVGLVVATQNNCYDKVVKPVRVHATPIAEFTGIDVCFLTPTEFTELSTIPGDNIETYNWDFGDGNSTLTQQPVYTYTADGTYDVMLTVISDSGCVDSVTYSVDVYPYPEPEFSADPVAGCQPLYVQFSDQSTISSGSIVSYSWDLGNNNSSVASFPSNTYTADGTYDITLTTTSNHGCDTSITKRNYITVYPLPKAGFIHEPDTFASIFDPEFQFYDMSSGADSIVMYDFGDGEMEINPNPLHTYLDTGFYHVTQYVYTIYGCGDTIDDWVRVKPEFTLYVPSAFTPNSDGINDVFEVKGIGVLEYRLRIFNRWGEEIYFSIDMDKFWDGTIRDTFEPAKEDVYIYTIYAVDVNFEEHTFKGHVSLVK